MELVFSLGFGTTVVRSKPDISDGRWYHVVVSVKDRIATVAVAGESVNSVASASAALGLRQLDIAAGK